MSTVLGPRPPNAAIDWTTSKENSVWTKSKTRPDTLSADRYYSDNESSMRSGLPTPPGTRAMHGVTLSHQPPQNSTAQPYQHSRFPSHSGPAGAAQPYESSGMNRQTGSQTHSNGLGAGHRSTGSQDWDFSVSKATSNSIASYLQIPESVNKSKGSLAEFAAEITCLFWFETAATLQFAEDIPNVSFIDRPLAPDATPSVGFRKWVTTILSTTQVGKNVILLALMFIYRLKKFNPAVSGKRGSEFRLLTIALMLGNKFLDDNTYTNKTWAEVSGIAVTEIHIMEVEFLSNMRYDLYASESEWAEWKAKLGRFGAFYEVASKYTAQETRSPITPLSQSFPYKIPSPPSSYHSAPFYPTAISATNYASLPNPTAAAPQLPRSPTRHYRNPVLEQLERKRSIDYSAELPPAKRMHPLPLNISPNSTANTPSNLDHTPGSGSVYTPASTASGGTFSEDSRVTGQGSRVPRLPMIQTTSSQPTTHLAPITFPAPRAMSTVYPNTSAAWAQPLTPVSGGPHMPGLYQNPIPKLENPGAAREHSNFASAQASPLHGGAVTPTRSALSPSYFLTHRSSPYRPVRGVNTLLIPPPSASLQNASRSIPFEQMHYQPLSKAITERRTGPMPYYQSDNFLHSGVTTPVSGAVPGYSYRA